MINLHKIIYFSPHDALGIHLKSFELSFLGVYSIKSNDSFSICNVKIYIWGDIIHILDTI